MTYTEPRIDLLYFNGCPSYKQAWSDILDVLVEEGAESSVRPIAVEDPEAAEEHQFAGSPTIKINGVDLEEYSGPGVMACRRYEENEGKGWPSKELIRRRLRAARNSGAGSEKNADL